MDQQLVVFLIIIIVYYLHGRATSYTPSPSILSLSLGVQILYHNDGLRYQACFLEGLAGISERTPGEIGG
jgi:hypothetical protein